MNKRIQLLQVNHRFGQQIGIVLPVVLIFLVIMTLLGITAIRNVTMEEKMAGSLRNQELAFQAAEEALRQCEIIVLKPSASAKFYANQSKPWYQLTTEELPATKRWLATDWTTFTGSWNDANYYQKVTLQTENNNLAEARCMVEQLQRGPDTTSEPGAAYTTCPFRITARAFGMDTNTVVVLQSYLIASKEPNVSCD